MSSEGNPGSRVALGPSDWNVIVTLAEPTFRIARKLLARWGRLQRTEHYNVATMAVGDPASFLREFGAAVDQSPGIVNAMSHVAPFERLFEFKDATEFEAKAREIAITCVPPLIGKLFHVRLHRITPTEERFLDEALLEALTTAGAGGRMDEGNTACDALHPARRRARARGGCAGVGSRIFRRTVPRRAAGRAHNDRRGRRMPAWRSLSGLRSRYEVERGRSLGLAGAVREGQSL